MGWRAGKLHHPRVDIVACYRTWSRERGIYVLLAREIELRPEQRKASTEAIQQTQAKTLELQWEMQDAATDLEREISQMRIDAKAALSAADRVMSIEGQVELAHLGLLIQIKHQLNAEQQQKLVAIRDHGGA